MINRIIDLSARHRIAVVLLALAGAAAGWWSLTRVPLDALPDLSDTQVIVYSTWDRSRMGVSIRARRRIGHAQPRGPALLSRLVSSLPLEVGPWRRRRGVTWRVRAAVPGERR